MGGSLAELIRGGKVDEFNRRVRDYEEDRGELPSLSTETFEEVELSGFDFSDIDLSYAEFADCTLTDVRFDRAALDGAYVHGTTFIECYFEETEATGFALDSCTFSKCTFEGVGFDNIEWTDCQFKECLFREIRADEPLIERTTFTDGEWDEVEFVGGNLKLVTLRSVALTEVDLTESDAKNCYVSGGTPAGADLPDGFIEKTGRRRRM